MKLMDLLNEGEEKRPLSNEVKKHFLEIVSTYNKYQEMMDRKSDIAEIAETLGGITEAAKTLAIHEGDDWFDKHTIKRNMSELDKLGKAFDKCAVEAKSLDQRLNGLYEDMGHILSRYYKLGEISEEQMKERLGMNESVNEGFINEWGSSDQNIMNKSIHKDAGSPKKMPSPFDRKLRDAAESAVDFYWDEWPEYKRDRDSLITNAVRSYLRAYFRKDFDMMAKLFESVNEETHQVQLSPKGNHIVNIKEEDDELQEDGKMQSGEKDPCWKGYEMVGKKMKNGKEVPNCVPKNESVTEDKGEVETIKKQVGKNEIKFYDALSKVEKRLGSKYSKFLDTALKQLKQNPSSFKTNAEKEEKLFQLVK